MKAGAYFMELCDAWWMLSPTLTGRSKVKANRPLITVEYFMSLEGDDNLLGDCKRAIED